MATNVFERDLAVVRKDKNKYSANVVESQMFRKLLHGGFAGSLIAFTGLEHVKGTLGRPGEHLVSTLRVEFLKPVVEGEVELEVEHLSVGKALIRLRIRLMQQATPRITGDVGILAATSKAGFTVDTQYRLSPPPARVNLSQLASNKDPDWVLYHYPYHLPNPNGMPLSHWKMHLMSHGLQHPRIFEQWYCLTDPNDRITAPALPACADTYLRILNNYFPDNQFSYAACVERAKRSPDGIIRPEQVKDLAVNYWALTQSLNLDFVKPLPPEGLEWVYLRVEAKVIRDGRMIAEVTMTDADFEILVLGQTTELYMPVAKTPPGARSAGQSKDGGGGGGERSAKI